MSPEQYCQEKAAVSGSSLYYSLLFVPPDRRRAITALYAFRCEVGELVDECSDRGVARAKLDWWRAELERCFRGAPQHPVTQALQTPLRDCNLPQEYFAEIIDGVQMDLDQDRYASFNELALYCYRVAGAVGLLSAEILGYRHRDTLKYAQTLGTALQLTRLLREVRDDARRGRLYLPLDELEAFSVDPRDLLLGVAGARQRALFEHQATRARHYYRRALDQLPEADRYRQRSGLIMAAIQQALLAEIEADGFRLLERRVRLTPLRKFWIAWRTARHEKRRCRRAGTC